LTKAKPKTENKKTVKDKKPKQTEKAKTKTETKSKTKKTVTKTKEKPKPKTKSKKKTEEKIQFLVSSHVLVPKHEIVSDSEIPTILKEFNIEKKSQFPKILADDAAVKEIGAKKGNVIRIYRKEPTGDCLYYRVVV
jgi:DNA-directed RNA polymerase subunit H